MPASTSPASTNASPNSSATSPLPPHFDPNSFSSCARLRSCSPTSAPWNFVPDHDALERELQRRCRTNPGEVLDPRRGGLVGIRRLAAEHPVGVAVALVGRPRVQMRAPLARRRARLPDRDDEAVASKQRPVELLREDRRGIVIHRPAGGDDAAHADRDQRAGNARRELGAVVSRVQQLCGIGGAEVAAVHEHELGNRRACCGIRRARETFRSTARRRPARR